MPAHSPLSWRAAIPHSPGNKHSCCKQLLVNRASQYSAHLLAITELYILSGRVAWYVNSISMKLSNKVNHKGKCQQKKIKNRKKTQILINYSTNMVFYSSSWQRYFGLGLHCFFVLTRPWCHGHSHLLTVRKFSTKSLGGQLGPLYQELQ